MFTFWNRKPVNSLHHSMLYDEKTFYNQFLKDLSGCQKEVIIESPYITSNRMGQLFPIFKRLLTKRKRVIIITRDPEDHDDSIKYQATNEILKCVEAGIKVIFIKGNFHRKLAIIDREILWEGSLNILSYNSSKEVMRRIESSIFSMEMFYFLKLDKIINSYR